MEGIYRKYAKHKISEINKEINAYRTRSVERPPPQKKGTGKKLFKAKQVINDT